MTETADKFTFKYSTHYYITWRQTVISGKYYSTNSKQKVFKNTKGFGANPAAISALHCLPSLTREIAGKTESQDNRRDKSNVLLIGHFVN